MAGRNPPKFESEGRRELLAIRKELGLTQSAFASKLGIPQPTYENYERGLRKLNPDVLLDARAARTAAHVAAGPLISELRALGIAERDAHYSTPARFLRDGRNYAFMCATFSVALMMLGHIFHIPLWLETPWHNAIFVAAFTIMSILLVATLQDAPLLKAAAIIARRNGVGRNSWPMAPTRAYL